MYRQLNARLNVPQVTSRIGLPPIKDIPCVVDCPRCGDKSTIVPHPFGGLSILCSCGNRTLAEEYVRTGNTKQRIEELANAGVVPKYVANNIKGYVESLAQQFVVKDLLEKGREGILQSSVMEPIIGRFNVWPRLSESFLEMLSTTGLSIVERAQLFNIPKIKFPKLKSEVCLLVPFESFYGDVSALQVIPINPDDQIFSVDILRKDGGLFWFSDVDVLFTDFLDFILAVLDVYDFNHELLNAGIVYGRPNRIWNTVKELKNTIIWGDQPKNSIEIGAISEKSVIDSSNYRSSRRSNPVQMVYSEFSAIPWYEYTLKFTDNDTMMTSLELDSLQWQALEARATPQQRSKLAKYRSIIESCAYSEVLVNSYRVRERSDGWYVLTQQGEELLSEAILRIYEVIGVGNDIIMRGSVTINGNTIEFTEPESKLKKTAAWIKQFAMRNSMQYPIINASWSSKYLQIAMLFQRPRQITASDLLKCEENTIFTPTLEIGQGIRHISGSEFSDLPFGITETSILEDKSELDSITKSVVAALCWLSLAKNTQDADETSLIVVGTPLSRSWESLEDTVSALNLDHKLSPVQICPHSGSLMLKRLQKSDLAPWSVLQTSLIQALGFAQRVNAVYIQDFSPPAPSKLEKIRQFALVCLMKLARMPELRKNIESFFDSLSRWGLEGANFGSPLSVHSPGLSFFAYLHALDSERSLKLKQKKNPLIIEDGNGILMYKMRILQELKKKSLPYPDLDEVERDLAENKALIDQNDTTVTVLKKYFYTSVGLWERQRALVLNKYKNLDPTGRIIMTSARA